MSEAHDWPAQAADTIERIVGTVRDRATGPALTAVRAVVFGVLCVFLGITLVVLLAIGSVRFLNSYLPGNVWVAHLATGTIFSVAGLWMFSKRHQPSED
jgi:Mn2+/Fe2+ NRAMP family transporter